MFETDKPIPEGALQWKAPDEMEKAKLQAESERSKKSELDVARGKELQVVDGVSIETPIVPWMPSNGGDEIRIRSHQKAKLLATELAGNSQAMAQHLAEIGRQAILAAEVSSAYAVDAPIESDEWHDAPWFNLNINSHLGGKEFEELTSQIYLRERSMKSGQETTGNPYWSLPIPADYPLSQSDRRPYDERRIESIKDRVVNKIREKIQEIGNAENAKLFFDEETGRSSFENPYQFDMGTGRVMIWEGDGY